MKTRFAVILALAALAPFAIGACGDDDGEEPETPAATTEETDTDGGNGGAGGASSVSFTTDPGGELAFEEDSATAQAGQVTLELTNESQVPHDVRIEGSGGEDIGGTDEITGGEASATVDLESGDYTFYCSVAGHRDAGMEGTLTVE